MDDKNIMISTSNYRGELGVINFQEKLLEKS